MLKSFIEWLEGDITRGRKVALMSTIFVFLFLTILTFIVSFFGIVLAENLISVYIALTTLMGTIFAFYTSTKASTDASKDQIDESMAKIVSKLKDYTDKL